MGKGVAGQGAEVAHIDLLIGSKDGPVAQAFAKAKAAPTPGHEPLLAILEPNLSIRTRHSYRTNREDNGHEAGKHGLWTGTGHGGQSRY